jgi:molecular chaperone GrpE
MGECGGHFWAPALDREASRVQAPSFITAPNPLPAGRTGCLGADPNRLLYLSSAMSDSFFDGPTTNEAAEEIQRLREALEIKTREAEAQQDRYLRAVAEFDNVRKRTAREREEHTRYANESLLRDILPVLDNLDRALQAARSEPVTSLTTGVELIQRELLRVLEKFGVAPFVSVGQPFDPERHEAIARVQRPDLPDMSVAGETARGYLLHGRVLRPAMVTVAVTPDDPGSAPDA